MGAKLRQRSGLHPVTGDALRQTPSCFFLKNCFQIGLFPGKSAVFQSSLPFAAGFPAFLFQSRLIRGQPLQILPAHCLRGYQACIALRLLLHLRPAVLSGKIRQCFRKCFYLTVQTFFLLRKLPVLLLLGFQLRPGRRRQAM